MLRVELSFPSRSEDQVRARSQGVFRTEMHPVIFHGNLRRGLHSDLSRTPHRLCMETADGTRISRSEWRYTKSKIRHTKLKILSEICMDFRCIYVMDSLSCERSLTAEGRFKGEIYRNLLTHDRDIRRFHWRKFSAQVLSSSGN